MAMRILTLLDRREISHIWHERGQPTLDRWMAGRTQQQSSLPEGRGDFQLYGELPQVGSLVTRETSRGAWPS